ncbi:hypothetical protein, partial [Burkholderia gladioli]|uniref:hypothetical protein n=1 Tax=Burkholderia gladioli TaxID=28095 RepID=UPI00264AFBA1
HLLHDRQFKSQAVVALRPLDPLPHLPPLRFVEKVSTYFRTGHRNEKSPASAGLFSCLNRRILWWAVLGSNQ